MPLRNVNGKWYWGSKGPFDTKAKALAVARAAYAHGYKGEQKNFSDDSGRCEKGFFLQEKKG